jgi:hypothetical protein
MPTREALTRSQLETLHTVIQALSPFLLGQDRHYFFHQAEEQVDKKIDGGVALSASLSFINVCSRIDAILEDKSRWDTSAHDKLYDAIAAVQKAQVDYLTAQADGAKMQQRPSVQFKPTIANDGTQFIAFYGDIEKRGYAIIGVGETPQRALDDFDQRFLKTPQEQIIMAAESRAEVTKTKTKKKPTTNEMDPNG